MMRRYPQSRFSCAIRTTMDSIWLGVRGRPGPRGAAPSYCRAISLRATLVAFQPSTKMAGIDSDSEAPVHHVELPSTFKKKLIRIPDALKDSEVHLPQ
jgi:hypothetical protein